MTTKEKKVVREALAAMTVAVNKMAELNAKASELLSSMLSTLTASKKKTKQKGKANEPS